MLAPTKKQLNIIASLSCFFIIIIGFGIEYLYDLKACPLCIAQRLIFFISAFLFALCAIVTKKKFIYKTLSSFNILLIFIGLALALRQTYLQLFPSEFATCGVEFEYVIKNFPALDILNFLLKGSGNCQEIQWSLFGISIPMWSSLMFLALLTFTIYINTATQPFKFVFNSFTKKLNNH